MLTSGRLLVGRVAARCAVYARGTRRGDAMRCAGVFVFHALRQRQLLVRAVPLYDSLVWTSLGGQQTGTHATNESRAPRPVAACDTQGQGVSCGEQPVGKIQTLGRKREGLLTESLLYRCCI